MGTGVGLGVGAGVAVVGELVGEAVRCNSGSSGCCDVYAEIPDALHIRLRQILPMKLTLRSQMLLGHLSETNTRHSASLWRAMGV